ncbi:hypothetical protein F4781DRAFT_407222 [Annulohypoxylon bovei var. microspora]|nr:hypothetical protein F4781DRAFT_407222 [Annulohypoxylon bovei var. microspora]
MADPCARCCVDLTFKCCLSFIAFVADRYIVQHREAIVRGGRRVQNALHLPGFLRVIADTEPGILKKELRRAGEFALGASFISGIGTLFAALKGTFWDAVVLVPFLIIPLCIYIVVWIKLICAKRKLMREGWNGKEDDFVGVEGREEENSGLEYSIQGIWAVNTM